MRFLTYGEELFALDHVLDVPELLAARQAYFKPGWFAFCGAALILVRLASHNRQESAVLNGVWQM